MTQEEKDRAERFREGDFGAFNELYDELGGRIYGFCLRLCRNRDDAEDLAAEVFLAAFRGRERFEGRSSLATWLYRIALYRWHRMKSARRATVPLEEAQEAAVGESFASLGLREAIDALPEPLRQAFVLVKCEQLRYREAAEVLGIPQGTVQYRVHEASMRLRQALADTPAEPRAALLPKECGYGL